MPDCGNSAWRHGRLYMKRLWEVICSLFLWVASWLHFLIVVPILIGLAVVLDPRKHDWLQRGLCRRIAFFSGATIVAVKAAGFDEKRTSIFMVNHVNVLDPFLLYCAIPQMVRGWELESHFRIPVYGWLMKRFGNVPVPDVARPADLKRMWRLTRAALDSGVSLLVFPEGGRTITGRVAEFQEGPFRMALQFGTPIVPVSIVGSFEFNRKTNWMLRPAKIVVYLHDVIETAGLDKRDAAKLSERVHEIVAEPVNAHIAHMDAARGSGKPAP